MKEKKLISLELSVDLINKLKKTANYEDLSMSDIIRQAIKTYLKDKDGRN